MSEGDPHSASRRVSLRAGLLIGIGIMAGIDEIVFHQLLGWHHFYDRATPTIGLISDGLLHAAELIAIVAGFFMLANAAKRQMLAPQAAWAGLLIGAGGFQIFDGLVNHKVFRVHQIRYDVHLLPYDIAWNAGGAVLLVAGLLLARQTFRSTAAAIPKKR